MSEPAKVTTERQQGSEHPRPLALTVFENEKATTPLKAARRPWSEVIQLHQSRVYRPSKSGLMLGGYDLNGGRKDSNVPYRSIIQLDIDSEGTKDKATGRLLTVSRSASSLDDVRPAIDKYEWIANSTHWHEPDIGAIKYRITMLPDRDILPDEYKAVLEALDEVMGGCLDKAAWSWSQAFYLPSCPAENAKHGFFVHNQGSPLPVDKLVVRGRQIIAAKQQSASAPASIANSIKPQLPETQENVQVVREMLSAIPADVGRKDWRAVVYSVRSLGWSQGEQLARDWSQSAAAKWDEGDFLGVWSSFDPARANAIGPGTLEHVARSHRYSGQSFARTSAFDGKGADVANGGLFADKFRGQLLNVHETDEWLIFDPTSGWLSAPPGEAVRAAKQVREDLITDCARQLKVGADEGRVKRLHRHIEYTSRASSVRAMIEMAKSEPGMTRGASEFDADPMLLGVENGVLDLRKRVLLPTSPDLLVTKRAKVTFDPTADCPTFLRFLGQVQPDPEMQAFLQRYCGYWLTGGVSEQVVAFLYGSGANGKTLFVELTASILGDYSCKIETEMLMEHKRSPQGPSPDVVALKGRRFAYASETEERHRLAASRVKEFSGGDTLSARVPYAKAAVTFTPSHKLVIVGNHKPDISDMSHGMWRRLHLIGFDQTIAPGQRDARLLDKLKAESSGILNWMLDGFAQWQKGGLQPPDAVIRATDEYRDEQDILGQWIAERCDVVAGADTKKADVYSNYAGWAGVNGHHPLSQSKLTKRLKERGFPLDPGRRHVQGLKLKR